MAPPSRLLPATLQILRRRCASRFSTASSLVSPPSKAVLYDEHGAPGQVLRVADVPPVHLGDRDVCVRNSGCWPPINPSDINRIEGHQAAAPRRRRGYEGVGQVHALGPAVTAPLSPGDWVILSPTSFGTWQTYIVKHKSRRAWGTRSAATCPWNTPPLSWPGSEEAKYKLKQLGADEVFTESQLDMKNLKSLLNLH